MKDLPFLPKVAVRSTIPAHFAVPAQPEASEDSSDSDSFTPTPPALVKPKPLFKLWSDAHAVCSHVLLEKPRGGEKGTLYTLGATIGRGAFGDVFVSRAQRPNGDKDLVCLKRVGIEEVDDFGLSCEPSVADNEATAMMLANTKLGPHKLLYQFPDKPFAVGKKTLIGYAYFELTLCHGNMDHAARQFDLKHPECIELLVLDMIEQTAKRLSKLHNEQWVHRDIKPENLLFLKKYKDDRGNTVIGDIFVGDYGRGKKKHKQNPRLAGLATPGFISPQAARGPCGYGDDVWALGASAVEMLTRINPFDPTPHVKHPKDSKGRRVGKDDTRLQKAQWLKSIEILNIYEDWFNGDKDNQSLTQLFDEMYTYYPRASKLVAGMLHPDREQRVSFARIVEVMGDEKSGLGVTPDERRQLNAAWQDVDIDPRVAYQSAQMGELPPAHSRTFDGDIVLPTGYEAKGLQIRAKRIRADVDGLAEKLAKAELSDVKASFERKYVVGKGRKYAGLPRGANALNTHNVAIRTARRPHRGA